MLNNLLSFIKHRLKDRTTRIKLTNYISTLINIFLIAWTAWLSHEGQSFYLILMVIYYVFLALGKLHLVMKSGQDAFKLNISALLFLIIGFSFIVINVWLILNQVKFAQPDIQSMLNFAFIGFVKIGVAIRGLFIHSFQSSAINKTFKLFNFADGLVSIALVQRTILLYENVTDAVQISAYFGILISLIIIGLGGWLLYYEKRSRGV